LSLIIDTNFIFALKSEKDKHHIRAREILMEMEGSKRFITNCFVLEETFTLAVFRGGANPKLMNIISDVFFGKSNFFNIKYLMKKEMIDIKDILRKYISPKRMLSFTDASLIYMYEQLNAECIITFDSHFDQIVERMY